MGFNHIGQLSLEGGASATVPFAWPDGGDQGAVYFAANPIALFESNGVIGNIGWAVIEDQEKAKDFANGQFTTYLITVRNNEPWGLTCDFDRGTF
jgi:hypothetical protein